MPLRNTDLQWGTPAKTFHWLIALLILGMMVLGWVATNYPLSPTKIKLFQWHKSTGLVILALVVLRLIWRLGNRTPGLPAGMSGWQRRAVHLVHGLLYTLMLAMPLSGWVINSAANFPLKLYGWFRVPAIAPADKALQTTAELVHLSLFWLLAILLMLHIAAALRHHYVQRDTVLRRMLPFSRVG